MSHFDKNIVKLFFEGFPHEVFFLNPFKSIREMMIEWTKQEKLFFGNMEKIEGEFYKFNEALANGSGDIKTHISKLFETLRSVSRFLIKVQF